MSQVGIRADLVSTAVSFLQNSRVRETSSEQQREFLKKKGLTEEEIDAAFSRVGPVPPPSSSGIVAPGGYPISNPAYLQPPPSTWKDYANVVALAGTASYGLWIVCRTVILPKFFGIKDAKTEQMEQVEEKVNQLQNNIRFVMDSVQQTLTAVQGQQENLQRALTILADNKERSGAATQNQIHELKTDISVIKSLLLSRNQFAPLPSENRSLPSWQLSGTNTSKSTNGVHKPTTNGIRSSDSFSSINSNGYTTPPLVSDSEIRSSNGVANGNSQRRVGKQKVDLEGEEDEDSNDEELRLESDAPGTPV